MRGELLAFLFLPARLRIDNSLVGHDCEQFIGQQLVAFDAGMHVVDQPAAADDAVLAAIGEELLRVGQGNAHLLGDLQHGFVHGFQDSQRANIRVFGLRVGASASSHWPTAS